MQGGVVVVRVGAEQGGRRRFTDGVGPLRQVAVRVRPPQLIVPLFAVEEDRALAPNTEQTQHVFVDRTHLASRMPWYSSSCFMKDGLGLVTARLSFT